MKRRFTGSCCILLFFAASFAFARSAAAGDWYRWRGPEQNGTSRETGLPDTWSPDGGPGSNLLWKSPVGSMSSPIVLKGKIYTFSRVEEVPQADNLIPGPKTQEALTCMDAATGNILWQHLERMTQTDVPFWRLGWANPAGDPETGRIYALGAQCTFMCLDGNDGHVIWKRQMTEEFGMISTFGGRTPSPAVDGDQVFLDGVAFGWGDNARGQHRLFAFNKNTGELNWTTGTGGIPTDAPQNTPVFTVIDNTRVVIFGAGDGNVACFQETTGKRLWTFRASKRGINTSIVIDGNAFYVTASEDNLDTNVMGRVAKVEFSDHGTKELWRINGIEAGFPSPILHDDRLYVIDNKGIFYAIDKNLGKVIWKKSCGTIGKGSPAWADGKLIVPEANGRVWILQDMGKSVKTLSKVELMEKLGREYVIYGSPAIANGCIYIQAATALYCIGNQDHKVTEEAIPAPPKEDATPGPLAQIVVTPADVVMHPGQKQKLVATGYDAKGHLIGVQKAEWSIGKLTLPPPPAAANPLVKPAAPAKPAAWVPTPDAKLAVGQPQLIPTGITERPQLIPTAIPPDVRASIVADLPAAPAAAAPPAAPAPPPPIGNLAGDVDADGNYTAAMGPFQGGGVFAKVGDVTGFSRVRVLPPLPWKFDFEKAPAGVPPLTWIGAGGKFAVRDMPENGSPNKVMVKLTTIPLYDRARTNFGTPDMTNYTVEADVKGAEIVIPPPEGAAADAKPTHQLPDVGVIDSRYVLALNGNDQELQIHVWPPALPFAVNKTIPFAWKANTWYRMKLKVSQEPNSSLVQGKVWLAGEKEPENWTIALVDQLPIRSGNPGLFAFSFREIETYYDNILVTENQP